MSNREYDNEVTLPDLQKLDIKILSTAQWRTAIVVLLALGAAIGAFASTLARYMTL